MKFLIRLSVLLATCWLNSEVHAQVGTYIQNGSADSITCNCYTLTPAALNTSGSVWNAKKIDLNNSFDFVFNVYLGCQDATGADGIVFMLQPISTSIGATGGGLGFENVKPSVGITLDTWQNENNNDPDYDHIAIQVNGNLTHGTDPAGPVQAAENNPNIEDCQWHTLRISWEATTKTLETYFDGIFRLRTTSDLVSTVFDGDPEVYWGFSAATGGSYNLQQFCTALNPGFATDATNDVACEGAVIAFTNASESFAPVASYYWDLGDGTSSTDEQITPHRYPAAGIYNVKMAITGLDGCRSDTLRRTISIGDYPVSDFTIADTCAGRQPTLAELSTVTVGSISQWQWKLDGNTLPSTANPDLSGVSAGAHHLSLQVTSNYGCPSGTTDDDFEVLPVPKISGTALDGCVRETVQFDAAQLDNSTTITNWNWLFEPGRNSANQHASYIFSTTGSYNVQLSATAANGCESDVNVIPVFINRAVAYAGKDTLVIKSDPYQLQGTGGATYSWSPGTWMTNTSIANPIVTPEDDITYELSVTTAEGCVDTDQIKLEVFKGSQVYVPTGFSPNNDGINDKLGPFYIGIREVGYFMVYNRWGQLLYTSHTRDQQWDGTINGIQQPAGLYVWRLAAADYVGKKYEMKGTTVLIR